MTKIWPRECRLLEWLERASPLLETQIVAAGFSATLNALLRDGLADMGAHSTVKDGRAPAAAVWITRAGRAALAVPLIPPRPRGRKPKTPRATEPPPPPGRFLCTCGARFAYRRHLMEHIWSTNVWAKMPPALQHAPAARWETRGGLVT